MFPRCFPTTNIIHWGAPMKSSRSRSRDLEQEPRRRSSGRNSMEPIRPKSPPFQIYIITADDSPEFAALRWAIRRSSTIALDAEWKPFKNHHHNAATISAPSPSRSFPTVTLLQIACRVRRDSSGPAAVGDSPVFLVDLLSIPLTSVWEMLRDMFVSPHVLKLGFKFKQDLANLSFTFSSQGGFDRVEPFLDITSIYYHLKDQKVGKKFPKETKSLATICQELLDISLSKELQCSDWSCRPLTEEQISYAAADAYYLLQIFTVFEGKFLTEGRRLSNLTELNTSTAIVGLREILEESNVCDNILKVKFCKASDMVKSSAFRARISHRTAITPYSWPSSRNILPMDKSVSDIVMNYGERILLKESDRRPRASRRKGRRMVNPKCKEKLQPSGDLQDSPPWDSSLGGDGCPKFLCDIMVEGLARHLRCVGIDAAIPTSRKPEPRQLLDQAYKEKRVLLTRDAKLLKHQYLIRNQVYRVNSLLKNDQLLEVIEAFGLKISEEELMSRCTKCNGNFNQKPLTFDEAVAATRGVQVIPESLINKEFWRCTDCNQLYWEGCQYQNAVQKFVTVCKLND